LGESIGRNGAEKGSSTKMKNHQPNDSSMVFSFFHHLNARARTSANPFFQDEMSLKIRFISPPNLLKYL